MADQSGFVYFQDLCVGTLHLNMSCGFTQKGLVSLALHPLAHQLANATSRFGGFAGAALGRLFIRTAVLHLAEHAFALQLLFQNAQRLVNIVVSYGYVHSKSLSFAALPDCAGLPVGNLCRKQPKNRHICSRNGCLA